MSDLQVALLFAWGVGTATIWLVVLFEWGTNDQLGKGPARAIFLAPLWPLVLVWLAIDSVRVAWHAADWRNKHD